MRSLCVEDGVRDLTMPAVVTAIILGSQCGSLLTLSIEAPAVGLAGASVAALAALTRLRDLKVCFAHAEGRKCHEMLTTDHGYELLN